jgi:hypothetical protein
MGGVSSVPKFDRWGRPIDEDEELVSGGRCPLRSNATKNHPTPTDYGPCRSIDCMWWSKAEKKCLRFRQVKREVVDADTQK